MAWKLWPSRWRWQRFYLEWVKTAFAGPYALAINLAFTLFLLIAAVIGGYRVWGPSDISLRWEDVLITLTWLIPLIAFGLFGALRFFPAPYLIYKRRSVALLDDLIVVGEFEPQSGFLDFYEDFPKAANELLEHSNQVIKHMMDVDIALRKTGSGMLMSRPRGDGPSLGLKHASRMAKDLRKYEKRMRKTHARMDGAAKRFCEDQAGVVATAVKLTESLADLSEMEDELKGFQRNFQRSLDGSDLKGKLKLMVDEPTVSTAQRSQSPRHCHPRTS